MPEVVGNRLAGNAGESDGDCLTQGGEGFCLELAQVLLDDKPTRLNGVEVRRVERYIAKASPNPTDCFVDPCDFMGDQTVTEPKLLN